MIPVFPLEGGVEVGGLVVNTRGGAAVSDQRKWGNRWSRTIQTLPERVIYNIANGLIPLGSAELRLLQKIVVYNERGSHMYDHTYAASSSSIPLSGKCVKSWSYSHPATSASALPPDQTTARRGSSPCGDRR